MRLHYQNLLENEEEDQENQSNNHQVQPIADKVDLSNLIDAIAEDDFFQELMNEVVRESVDGEKETFEELLYRLMNDFKKPQISWLQFLGHFSKRGRL